MVSEAPWDIYRSARPLLALSRVVGLAPVRLSSGSGGAGGGAGLLPSWGATLWAVLLCVAFTASLVFYLIIASLAFFANIDDSKMVFTGILQMVLTYGSALCAVGASTALLRRRLGALLAGVAAVDRALTADRTSLYRLHRRRLLLSLAFLALVIAAFFAYEGFLDASFLDNAFDWFFFYFLQIYPSVVCILLDAQIIILIVNFKIRFRRVNEYFEALLNECQTRNRVVDTFLNGSFLEKNKNILPEEEKEKVERQKALEGPVLLDEKLCRTVFSDVFYGGSTPVGDKPGPDSCVGSPPGLNSLFRAHDALCDGLEQLNDGFGVQVYQPGGVLWQLALASAFFGGYMIADVATQAGRYHTPYDWAFHFVPHVLPHVFNVIMGLQYSNWTLLLWSRMRALNRRLTPLADAGALSPATAALRRSSRKRASAVVPVSAAAAAPAAEAHPTAVAAAAESLAAPETTASRLRRLQSAHLALNEAGSCVDAAFSVPLLLETCYLASELVSRAYALYRTGLPRHALWLAVTGIRLTALAAPAHACGVVARRTAELLGRASLAPLPDAEDRRALRDFSRQAALHQLRFSAAGIFGVDATLLLKVMVVAVTYIIIVVQFECKQKPT